MKHHRLISIIGGTVLAVLAVVIVILWATGGADPTFAMFSIGVIAALAVALRLWSVNQAESEYHAELEHLDDPDRETPS